MKKITTIILSTACAFAVGSAFADADGLTIVNQSSENSTMKIFNVATNKSICTGQFPNLKGITPAGKTNEIGYGLVDILLGLADCKEAQCSVDIYNDNNCGNAGGKNIAEGSIDNTSGKHLVSIDSSKTASDYTVQYDSDNATLTIANVK